MCYFFFSSVCVCEDDLEEAYQTLRRVVNEYLMLEEKDGEENDIARANIASKGLVTLVVYFLFFFI